MGESIWDADKTKYYKKKQATQTVEIHYNRLNTTKHAYNANVEKFCLASVKINPIFDNIRHLIDFLDQLFAKTDRYVNRHDA